MSFVRKPRPYSSGLPSLNPPAAPASHPPRGKREQTARPARRLPSSPWATAVTALAVLGTVLVTLVGVSGLANQIARDAQFRSAAAGVADVVR